MNKENYDNWNTLIINTDQINDLITVISDELDVNKPASEHSEHVNDVINSYNLSRVVPLLNTLLTIICELNSENSNILNSNSKEHLNTKDREKHE